MGAMKEHLIYITDTLTELGEALKEKSNTRMDALMDDDKSADLVAAIITYAVMGQTKKVPPINVVMNFVDVYPEMLGCYILFLVEEIGRNEETIMAIVASFNN